MVRIFGISGLLLLFLFSSATQAAPRALLNQSIERLSSIQLPSGAFPETQCSDKQMTEKCATEDSIFVTALVLDSLWQLRNEPRVKPMREKALRYLLDRQAEWGGLMKYFPKSSNKQKLIKKDVDVNSIVFGVLTREGYDFDPAIFEELRTDSLRPLKMTRSDGGATYRGYFLATWLKPSTPVFWDVDVVVNLNALWFYGARKLSHPQESYDLVDTCTFVNEVVKWTSDLGTDAGLAEYYRYNDRAWYDMKKAQEATYSAYYPSPYTLAYVLARAAPVQDCLAPSLASAESWLLADQHYGLETPYNYYDQAAAAAALLRIAEFRKQKGIEIGRLLAHARLVLGHLEQQLQGAARPGFFYNGYLGYIGSEALESAWAAEAAATYLKLSR